MKTLTTVQKLRKLVRREKESYYQRAGSRRMLIGDYQGLVYYMTAKNDGLNQVYFDKEGNFIRTLTDGKFSRTDLVMPQWATELLNSVV